MKITKKLLLDLGFSESVGRSESRKKNILECLIMRRTRYNECTLLYNEDTDKFLLEFVIGYEIREIPISKIHALYLVGHIEYKDGKEPSDVFYGKTRQVEKVSFVNH